MSGGLPKPWTLGRGEILFKRKLREANPRNLKTKQWLRKEAGEHEQFLSRLQSVLDSRKEEPWVVDSLRGLVDMLETCVGDARQDETCSKYDKAHKQLKLMIERAHQQDTEAAAAEEEAARAAEEQRAAVERSRREAREAQDRERRVTQARREAAVKAKAAALARERGGMESEEELSRAAGDEDARATARGAGDARPANLGRASPATSSDGRRAGVDAAAVDEVAPKACAGATAGDGAPDDGGEPADEDEVPAAPEPADEDDVPAAPEPPADEDDVPAAPEAPADEDDVPAAPEPPSDEDEVPAEPEPMEEAAEEAPAAPKPMDAAPPEEPTAPEEPSEPAPEPPEETEPEKAAVPKEDAAPESAEAPAVPEPADEDEAPAEEAPELTEEGSPEEAEQMPPRSLATENRVRKRSPSPAPTPEPVHAPSTSQTSAAKTTAAGRRSKRIASRPPPPPPAPTTKKITTYVLPIERKWLDLIMDQKKKADYRSVSNRRYLVGRDPATFKLKFQSGKWKFGPYALFHPEKSPEIIRTCDIPPGEAPPPGTKEHEKLFDGAEFVIKIHIGELIESRLGAPPSKKKLPDKDKKKAAAKQKLAKKKLPEKDKKKAAMKQKSAKKKPPEKDEKKAAAKAAKQKWVKQDEKLAKAWAESLAIQPSIAQCRSSREMEIARALMNIAAKRAALPFEQRCKAAGLATPRVKWTPARSYGHLENAEKKIKQQYSRAGIDAQAGGVAWASELWTPEKKMNTMTRRLLTHQSSTRMKWSWPEDVARLGGRTKVRDRAAKASEIPNFKGS